MVGWHYQLNRQELEQTLEDSEGHTRLACYSPWDCKELETTDRLNGLEFERTPGDGEGQGSLACSSPWGHKELDMTE